MPVFTSDGLRQYFYALTAHFGHWVTEEGKRKPDENFDLLNRLIAKQRMHIELESFENVRRIDIYFHQQLVSFSNNSYRMQYYKQIATQVGSLLTRRKQTFPDYDEFQAITNHEDIVAAYQTRDLQAVARVNARLNSRMTSECEETLVSLGIT